MWVWPTSKPTKVSPGKAKANLSHLNPTATATATLTSMGWEWVVGRGLLRHCCTLL